MNEGGGPKVVNEEEKNDKKYTSKADCSLFTPIMESVLGLVGIS